MRRRIFLPVKSGLEKVSFPWVFRVKEFEQLQHELLVDVLLGHRRLEVRRFQAPGSEQASSQKKVSI